MFEYQTTQVSFGWGMQRPSTRTHQIGEHIQSMASQGWRLHSMKWNWWERPLACRFVWEKQNTL